MSYEIVYDKQFIQVKDKFLPFILCGSNNCYDSNHNGRERRSRDWWLASPNYSLGLMQPMTKEEMVNQCRKNLVTTIERYLKDEDGYSEKDIRQRYGYFTSMAINGNIHNTSYKTYENVYAIGCDKAITIDKLHNYYGSLTIETSYYDVPKLKGLNLEPVSISIMDEDQFFEVYNNLIKIYGSMLRITLRLDENAPKRIRWIQNKTRVKKEVETVLVRIDGYYTLKTPNGNYFVKNQKYSYKFSYQPYHNFATEAEAKKKAYGKRNCIVEKMVGEITIRVKKEIVNKLKNVLVVSD